MSQHRTRRTLLLLALGLLLSVYGGDWLWSVVTEPVQSLRQKQQALSKDIERRQLQLAQARKAGKVLADWAAESLPSEPQVARSVYQAWLLESVSRAGLSSPAVDSTQPSARNGYVSITFSLQARGTLQQWTQFLYDFYRAGQLHQLRSLAFTPISKREQLDAVLAIEAIVLPDAERTDRLNEVPSERLAFAELQDYQPIVLRNLFGVGAALDPSEQTYLTGIHTVNGVPEAWFTLRHESQPDRAVVKLRVGQTLAVGQFHGDVVEIATDDVVLEADGERWLLALGENLGEACALPPGF